MKKFVLIATPPAIVAILILYFTGVFHNLDQIWEGMCYWGDTNSLKGYSVFGYVIKSTGLAVGSVCTILIYFGYCMTISDTPEKNLPKFPKLF